MPSSVQYTLCKKDVTVVSQPQKIQFRSMNEEGFCSDCSMISSWSEFASYVNRKKPISNYISRTKEIEIDEIQYRR